MDSGSLTLYSASGPTNVSLHRACEFSCRRLPDVVATLPSSTGTTSAWRWEREG